MVTLTAHLVVVVVDQGTAGLLTLPPQAVVVREATALQARLIVNWSVNV